MLKDIKKGMAEYQRAVSHIKKADPAARAAAHGPAPPKAKEVKEVDRTSELWQSVYRNSVATGHPEPEKMADSCVRSREKALQLAEERASIQRCDKRPPQDNAKPAAASCKRCKAVTFAGVPCGFAATCGEFCRRHAPPPHKVSFTTHNKNMTAAASLEMIM